MIGYLGPCNILTDWEGNKIGTYVITATWKTPRSYISNTMNQVRATVDGVVYVGRSAGLGMLLKGKREQRRV